MITSPVLIMPPPGVPALLGQTQARVSVANEKRGRKLMELKVMLNRLDGMDTDANDRISRSLESDAAAVERLDDISVVGALFGCCRLGRGPTLPLARDPADAVG